MGSFIITIKLEGIYNSSKFGRFIARPKSEKVYNSQRNERFIKTSKMWRFKVYNS
jgi:hypothetical protein